MTTFAASCARARGWLPLLFLLAAVLPAAACNEDDNGGPGGPTGNQLSNGRFDAVVDGQFYAPVTAGVTVTETHTSIATAGGGLAFSFTVAATEPGIYELSASTSHLAVFTGPGALSWDAQGSRGSGTITISVITGERLAGTFSLVLAPQTNTGATTDKVVSSGVFDLTY